MSEHLKGVNFQTVVTRTFQGNQSWDRESVHLLRGYRVRVLIRADAYRNQCYARGEVWSEHELRWNYVTSIPFSQMTAHCQGPDSPVNYMRPLSDAGNDAFDTDEDLLLVQLDQILPPYVPYLFMLR